jgi:hypothetical protein
LRCNGCCYWSVGGEDPQQITADGNVVGWIGAKTQCT